MKYKHIVFDIDGTLIDTEYAVLHSLQETIKGLSHQRQGKNLRMIFVRLVSAIISKQSYVQTIHRNINPMPHRF